MIRGNTCPRAGLEPATLLEQLSVKVWYDEFSLKLGDGLSTFTDKEDFSKTLLAYSVCGRNELETRLTSSEIEELGTLWEENYYDF